MEKSISSSQNTTITTSQESSWTKYFDYFSASEEKRKGGEEAISYSYSYASDDVVGDSTVFDAASCAGEKPLVGFEAGSISCKMVKVKRRKMRGLLDEDPLEDTASSPVNSPKVSDLNQLELSPPAQLSPPNREIISVSKGNEIIQIHAKECTDLKKRGLCLVPISMLLENYRSQPMRTRHIS